MIKSSPSRSRAENVLNLQTLFEEYPEKEDLRPYTETQKSHRQGGQFVLLFVLRKLTNKIYHYIIKIIIEITVPIIINLNNIYYPQLIFSSLNIK